MVNEQEAPAALIAGLDKAIMRDGDDQRQPVYQRICKAICNSAEFQKIVYKAVDWADSHPGTGDPWNIRVREAMVMQLRGESLPT